MTKQTRGSKRNGRRGNPNQDVQPWLGWIAALLVVVIVVVAVAMGMEHTNSQRNGEAEVSMTPLVGGMALPVATETTAGSTVVAEITPLPEAITETTTISGGAQLTSTDALTGTEAISETAEMTATNTVSATNEISVTDELTATAEVTATDEATATDEVTTSTEVTVGATTEVTVTEEATTEATTEATAETTVTPDASVEPTARPTSRPTATTRPTVTPTLVAQVFEPGDTVVGSGERVEVYADASLESMVLDSYGEGVALEVLDPSGDYTSYPVMADGHGWARVRAADGLVGWIMTDQVEAQ
jgi:hypothetical protein